MVCLYIFLIFLFLMFLLCFVLDLYCKGILLSYLPIYSSLIAFHLYFYNLLTFCFPFFSSSYLLPCWPSLCNISTLQINFFCTLFSICLSFRFQSKVTLNTPHNRYPPLLSILITPPTPLYFKITYYVIVTGDWDHNW